VAGRPVGQVAVGLATPEPEALREVVTALAEQWRKRRPWPLRPGLAVTVDADGPEGEPLRDAILREWRRLPA
jgi:hypothetical protein